MQSYLAFQVQATNGNLAPSGIARCTLQPESQPLFERKPTNAGRTIANALDFEASPDAHWVANASLSSAPYHQFPRNSIQAGPILGSLYKTDTALLSA